jgi:UDP-N-acetylmuramoyl-L-alanyl-D-glutamate--2,6-diaminopimelate ligase
LLSDADVVSAPRTDPSVTGIAYRSDAVISGDAFFCIPGFRHDGHDFAADAVSRGAVAVVAKRDLANLDDTPVAIVSDPRAALALASSRFYGYPSERMQLVGVTGTNGKTTTTYLLDSVLRAADRTTGLLGTVEIRVGDERRPAGRTTPESADLQAIFAEMIERGVEAAVMEVSSHAIDLHRVDGVRFAVAAFTNLSQDHLDYHQSMEEYYAVKRRLFTDLSEGPAVINVDDPAGETLAGELPDAWTVGFGPRARVRASDLDLGQRVSAFTLACEVGEARVRLPLAGRYNVSNALVAAGCGLALGLDMRDIVEGLEAAPQVPGRLERIDCAADFSVFVDYAHTPDGLEKAISAVRDVTRGRVITVFGCGGDRDPEKRPLMGAAAGLLSDVVVVTSDNPRSEDPVGIILHIEDGLRPVRDDYLVEVDRHRAIERAVAMAEPGDAVLVAGKGHEDYQIFAERTIHFDDREVVREVLSC